MPSRQSDFLLRWQHPTSMQSLVSSSAAAGGGGGGVSNPAASQSAESTLTDTGRRHQHHHHYQYQQQTQQQQQHQDQVYCGLTEPIEAPLPPHRRLPHRRQHWRHVGRACARAKRVGCLRSALLAAFVLILLGVIVTSSYAIDRRFSQMPELLYAGLCLCSIGLFIIVVSVSMLVTRQLGKQHQHQHQQHHQASAVNSTRRSGTRGGGGGGGGRVPIWYIGCHRDAATAYCPPVPPSYWDAAAATTATVPAGQSPWLSSSLSSSAAPGPGPSGRTDRSQQQALHPPPPPRKRTPLPLPPQLPQQQPMSPPSYQEAVRCLEAAAAAAAAASTSCSGRPRQTSAVGGSGSCDQLSVLKWTVQPQQNMQAQHHQRHHSHSSSAASSVRRCESSSFLGEPILV